MRLHSISHAEHNKQMKDKKSTNLVSTGVEEVAQADNVAVVQLPHDLQFTVLNKAEQKKIFSFAHFFHHVCRISRTP